jgi:hypothetical protein
MVKFSIVSPVARSFQLSQRPASANGLRSFMHVGLLRAAGGLPFIEAIRDDEAAVRLERLAEGRRGCHCFGSGIDHLVADLDILCPKRNQTPAKLNKFAADRIMDLAEDRPPERRGAVDGSGGGHRRQSRIEPQDGRHTRVQPWDDRSLPSGAKRAAAHGVTRRRTGSRRRFGPFSSAEASRVSYGLVSPPEVPAFSPDIAIGAAPWGATPKSEVAMFCAI